MVLTLSGASQIALLRTVPDNFISVLLVGLHCSIENKEMVTKFYPPVVLSFWNLSSASQTFILLWKFYEEIASSWLYRWENRLKKILLYLLPRKCWGKALPWLKSQQVTTYSLMVVIMYRLTWQCPFFNTKVIPGSWAAVTEPVTCVFPARSVLLISPSLSPVSASDSAPCWHIWSCSGAGVHPSELY